MTEAGQKPVVLSRQIEGFALNRIQYAILNECWRLLADGILDVKDIDSVMSDGLGMRYAFLGPMETTHLNAEGITVQVFKKRAKIDFLTALQRFHFVLRTILQDHSRCQRDNGPNSEDGRPRSREDRETTRGDVST